MILIVTFWIISAVIFFVLLYTVIQSAMDNTKMASNIQELRDHFVAMKQDNFIISKSVSILEVDSDEEVEDCPACGNKVTLNEVTCPVCELTLRD